MGTLADDVKGLFSFADSEERRFFRRAPTLKSIEKGFENFELLSKESKVLGRRVNMGEVKMFDNLVVGYHAFSVLDNASATKCERDYMDMGKGLNYVFSKKIFVHSDYRGRGFGSDFIRGALDLSEKLGKHYIIDVDEDNYSMVNILNQFGIEIDSRWKDSKGIEMIRFYRE